MRPCVRASVRPAVRVLPSLRPSVRSDKFKCGGQSTAQHVWRGNDLSTMYLVFRLENIQFQASVHLAASSGKPCNTFSGNILYCFIKRNETKTTILYLRAQKAMTSDTARLSTSNKLSNHLHMSLFAVIQALFPV